MRASFLAVVLLALPASGFASQPDVGLASSSAATVTIYSAKWCGACKSLEAGLRDKNVPFDTIDVDENPGAYAIAKKATGANVIPITNVLRGPSQAWIVGADVDAVVRAYEGD